MSRFLELIDSENERDGHLFLAKEIETCWDESLGAALLEKSRSAALKPQILGSVLESLFQHSYPGAHGNQLSYASMQGCQGRNRNRVKL